MCNLLITRMNFPYISRNGLKTIAVLGKNLTKDNIAFKRNVSLRPDIIILERDMVVFLV